MFNAVHEALHSGKAVGIFPEGGSHDRPSLLPLKAGVAIMALGALAKHPNLPLRLVPVGLNYFSGHRFRSRVFVDIGEPLTVPPHLLPKYCSADKVQKREATDELMRMVNTALSALTISAPDYETLEFFWTLRRLVKTTAGPLSLDDQTELARRFASGYDRLLPDGRRWKDTARVQVVRKLTSEYNGRLKNLGLRDYQVAHVMTHLSRPRAATRFLGRVVMLLAAGVLWLPITLLGLPLLLLPRIVSAFKSSQALRKSKVKIYGRDVAATWKVLVALVLVPVLWGFYTYLSGSVANLALHLSLDMQRETMLVVFFLLPLLSYLYILMSEQMLMVARSLLPLLMLALRPGDAHELTEQREQLRLAMHELVDEDFGWKEEAMLDYERRTPRASVHQWVSQFANSSQSDDASSRPPSLPSSQPPSQPPSQQPSVPPSPERFGVSIRTEADVSGVDPPPAHFPSLRLSEGGADSERKGEVFVALPTSINQTLDDSSEATERGAADNDAADNDAESEGDAATPPALVTPVTADGGGSR